MKREIMAKLERQGISDRSPEDITLSDDDYSSLESRSVYRPNLNLICVVLFPR